MQTEDAKLLVLDSLCSLCQNLKKLSTAEEQSSFEELVVTCRQQYIDYKADVQT